MQLSGIFALPLFALDLVSAQDQFFDTNGVRIRYVDQGSGQLAVLLHGFGGNLDASGVETGVLPNLATDYRVIALDYRGHGKSDKPHAPQSYGLQMGQDVVRPLDHLNIARAHIVGYSPGAGITAQLLTTNPDRFLTATLSGAAGRQQWTPQTNPLTLADLKEALKGLATKEDLKALAPQETVNAIMETMAETKEGMTGLTGVMQDMLEELTATYDDVSVRTTVTTLAQSDAAHEAAIESLRKRLERVKRKVGIAKS